MTRRIMPWTSTPTIPRPQESLIFVDQFEELFTLATAE